MLEQQPAVVESQMPNVSTGDGEHIERNERRRLSAGQSTRAIGAGPEALLQHIEAQAPVDPSRPPRRLRSRRGSQRQLRPRARE